MCNAFSFIVVRSGKVYWKRGMDRHEDLKVHFNLDDTKEGNLVSCEISPKNKDYLQPDEWVFTFDEVKVPDWWRVSHENASWGAFKKWKKEVYAIVNVKKLLAFKSPFEMKSPRSITNKHKALLREVAFVRDSVWNSVGDSVRASVGASVRNSVWDSVLDSVWDSVGTSVRDSVGASVWDSVWGSVGDYMRASYGSNFNIPRSDWKYTENIKTKGYPFASYVKLLNMGLVPSFDGKTWRLHGGKDAKVLYEVSVDDLKKEVNPDA